MQRFGGVRTRAYLLSRYGPEPGCAILLVGRERFRALSDNLGYSFGEEPTKQGRKGMIRSKDSRIVKTELRVHGWRRVSSGSPWRTKHGTFSSRPCGQTARRDIHPPPPG